MVLSWNRYGKSRVRLVKVRRSPERHEVADLTLDVQLEGAFDAVYIEGDNAACLPTDTMKNTVYALARQDDLDHAEAFAVRLADHFAAKPGVTAVRISVVEHRWERLSIAGRLHPHAFAQPGGEHWTAVISRDAAGTQIVSGLANLVLLKTSQSAFAGYPRDRFTTLPETTDRVLATSVTAYWSYRAGTTAFGVREAIRQALVDTFAVHDSQSVQHTLYAMANAALAASPEITEITMTLPNRHHVLVDLTPFGLDNPNQIFVATDQPFGVIEATVAR
jgi:urate oxidase